MLEFAACLISLRRNVGQQNFNAGQPFVFEESLQLALCVFKCSFSVLGNHSQFKLADRSLDKLESSDRLHLFQNLIQGHRCDPDTVFKGQNVVCTAFDFEPMRGLAATARLVMYDDTVCQFIANKRLDVVSQIGNQDFF